jgi:hypothetical protein
MKKSTNYFYIAPPPNLVEELLRERKRRLEDDRRWKKMGGDMNEYYGRQYYREEENLYIREYFKDFLTSNRFVFFYIENKWEIQVSITSFFRSSLNWKSSLEIGFTANSNLFDEYTKQLIQDKNRTFFINFYSNPDFVKEAKEGKIRVSYLYEYKYFCDVIVAEVEKMKTYFRERIWCELIERTMRPDRLVKIAGLYGLDLTEYIDLMGF